MCAGGWVSVLTCNVFYLSMPCVPMEAPLLGTPSACRWAFVCACRAVCAVVVMGKSGLLLAHYCSSLLHACVAQALHAYRVRVTTSTLKGADFDGAAFIK